MKRDDIQEGPKGELGGDPERLDRHALLEIVIELQEALYVQRPEYEQPFWNEEKPFGAYELKELDEVMKKHRLAPRVPR